MKRVSKMALGAALAVSVSGAAVISPAFAQKKGKEAAVPAAFTPKLSKEFRKPIAEAQAAATAKDFALANTKLAEAAPLAKTPDEKYTLGQVRLSVGTGMQDEKIQRQAVTEVVESGTGPAELRPKFLFYQGNFAYKANDYPAAITALSAAQQAGYADSNLNLMLAEAYFKSNQLPAGLQQVEQAIAAEKAAGRVPPENWYQRASSVAYAAKANAEVAKWTRLQLEAYPNNKNWRTALVIYRDSSQLDDQTSLDLLRLMRASKALASERDYYEYAQLANDKGLPGEAKAVVDEGIATGVFDKSNRALNEIGSIAGAKVNSDRASLAASEKQAGSAANGKLAASTGDAYLGYGDYAKAAALYQTALQKGGVDNNVVNTRLGIALARSGQKDAAKAAFAAVTGPRTELAKFWTLWMSQTA